jgi:small-conductance mechanosensitive channel
MSAPRWILPLLLLLQIAAPALAQDPVLSLRIGEAENKLQVIEKSLDDPRKRLDREVLKLFQEQGQFVKQVAQECIDKNESAINKSAEDLELLGPQSLGDDKEVLEKRKSLNRSMLSHAQQLASCRLMLLRAHEVVDVALAKQQQQLASELFARRPNLLDNIKNSLLHPIQAFDAAVAFVQSASGIEQALKEWLPLTLLALLAVAVSLLVKRWLKQALRRHAAAEQKGYLSQFQLSLMTCANRYLPPLLLTGSLSGYFLWRYFIARQPWDFLGVTLSGLFLYSLINLAIRVVLNPCPPGQPLTRLPEEVSTLLARRLRLLSKLLLVGYLMYAALQIHQFPQQITGLLRNIYLFLLVLNLIWAVWLLRYYETLSNHLLRVLIIFGLVVTLLADWMGYANLANYLLVGITGSMLAWAVTIFVLRLWSDFLDGLDEGRNEWQRRFRKIIGVKGDDYLPGSVWFRFTFALVVWSVFGILLLKIWGLPDTALISLKDSITQGFDIGTVHVVPAKVVIALLSFAVMLSIIGWIKRRMDKSWLNRSRMDRGAKESLISLTGYFGVAVAFLISLSIAGVQLSNLALIAGALSVGIGFGLQNIVNNFVSGVILLFERPIKTGDWIVVGNTEGYVKKISIRSTQIQTFDRSDVIVPNSELISDQVTNWMLRDTIGRIKVPIGVAYGSDLERVREILLEIAFNHDSVITQSPILPKPWVLVRQFGDSSIDFELRCFIKDIDRRLRVISDINFAIDKAFRAAGIEIPFPQRDVHLIAPDETPDEAVKTGRKTGEDTDEAV